MAGDMGGEGGNTRSHDHKTVKENGRDGGKQTWTLVRQEVKEECFLSLRRGEKGIARKYSQLGKFIAFVLLWRKI